MTRFALAEGKYFDADIYVYAGIDAWNTGDYAGYGSRPAGRSSTSKSSSAERDNYRWMEIDFLWIAICGDRFVYRGGGAGCDYQPRQTRAELGDWGDWDLLFPRWGSADQPWRTRGGAKR